MRKTPNTGQYLKKKKKCILSLEASVKGRSDERFSLYYKPSPWTWVWALKQFKEADQELNYQFSKKSYISQKQLTTSVRHKRILIVA